MPTATFQQEGLSIDVTRESITVDAISEPDPEWEYVDDMGHIHFYDKEMNLPTLEERKAGEYWCSLCRDTHIMTTLHCKECGEEITPGTRKPPTKTINAHTEVSGEVWADSPHFEEIVQTFGGDPCDIDLGPIKIIGVLARSVTLHHCEFVAEAVEHKEVPNV